MADFQFIEIVITVYLETNTINSKGQKVQPDLNLITISKSRVL